MWNVRQSTLLGLPRTNNAVKGFHSCLRSSVTCVHPNFWKFRQAISAEETLVQTNILQAQRGDPPKKKKIYEQVSSRLIELVAKYERNEALDFLMSFARCLH